MGELFRESLTIANLPYTILLGLTLLYWLTVFFGALDLEFLDFEVDADIDADVDLDVDIDADVDADVDAGGGNGAGWFMTGLAFFNLGAVPFMVFMSLFVLTLWVTSILVNSLWLDLGEWAFFILLVPNLIVGLFVTKVLSTPFKGVYKKMNAKGTSKRELVGKIADVTMTVRPNRIGRVELTHNDTHFTLDVRIEGDEEIQEGEKAILVQYDAQADDFVVTKF